MPHLWLLLSLLGLGHGLDTTSSPVPRGLNIQKIQNLMRSVDPKSCGCARPDQHCEVPVPEARFVGFTCRLGQFCCRRKRRQGPVQINTIPQNLADVVSDPGVSPQEFLMTRQKASQVAAPRVDDVKTIERQDPVTSLTQRPVFDPTKKRVVTMDNLEPYDLGIPKEVKAFIRPVSELKKRTLDLTLKRTLDLTTTKAPSTYSSVCRCERMESCPAEKRDYITFRKSCPFGQVQCCRSFGNREEFDNLSKISGPARVTNKTRPYSRISCANHHYHHCNNHTFIINKHSIDSKNRTHHYTNNKY